jgi:hypothetical protein
MQSSLYRFLVLIADVLAVAALALAISPRVDTPAPSFASPDTTIVILPDATIRIPPAPQPPDPPRTPAVKKRIVIGGSGVRIEGEVENDDSSTFEYNFNFGESQDYGTDDDIVRVGESVYVAPGEMVAGDVVVFGGNAIIEGTVTGTVVVLGGEIRVRGGAEIRGDIVAIGGKIVEDDDVVIRGEKILVGGIATHVGDALDIGGDHLRAIVSGFLLFVGLILFLITLLFLRGRVERTGEYLSSGLLRSFGAGVLASIALQFGILIVTIPLIITVIGIPLAAILLLSYVGVFVIACTVFAFAVGRAISSRAGIAGGAFVKLLVGFLVLSIPELVAFVFDSIGHGPMNGYVFLKIISVVLWLFGYIVGLGSIVLSRFGTRPPVDARRPGAPATEYSPSPAS